MEIENVSDTALWVAVYRAEESLRPDALFKDPLASRLIGDRGNSIAKNMDGSKYTRWTIVIRTVIIDNFIKKLVAEGVDTIVNLGAGLDTRPYRMGLPSTLKWIEVDYPHMIKLKNEKLHDEKPTCQLQRISMDLSHLEERRKLFSEISAQSKKVLILTEGVIPYLTEAQVADLAADILKQKNFSFWIIDYINPLIYKYILTKKRKRQMKNAPFVFLPKDWIGFFQNHGWKIKDATYTPEETVRLGRPVPMPWWAAVLRFIFRPEATQMQRQSSGYLLLEPKK